MLPLFDFPQAENPAHKHVAANDANVTVKSFFFMVLLLFARKGNAVFLLIMEDNKTARAARRLVSAVSGRSIVNIITQKEIRRKSSTDRRMSVLLNFLKSFYYFLKNRGKWGERIVLFSPLCGQLSCLETAARQEKPKGEALTKEGILLFCRRKFC